MQQLVDRYTFAAHSAKGHYRLGMDANSANDPGFGLNFQHAR